VADRARNRSPLFKGLSFLTLRKKLGVRPPGHVMAIDVDGAVLRVVQAVPRGNRTVVTRIAAERLDLPAEADRSDPAVMGKAMAKALERLRMKPSLVVMGVPRASVVLRTLSLPVIDDLRELASVVHFQVGKDLPFRKDEAVIDFKVRRQLLPPPPTEPTAPSDDLAAESKNEPPPVPPKLEVLVAAVRREVVDFYQQTAAAAGFKLAALGLLSYGNARCLEACGVVEGGQAVALVSLRPDEVSIDVVAQQSLLFSRGAVFKSRTEPGGTPESGTPPAPDAAAAVETPPEKPETFVDAVTIEVVRSLHSYGGMEPQNPVAQVVVAGATGQEPAVVEALQTRLSMPCTWLALAGALELPKAAREHAAGSLSAIGLALGVNDPQGLPFDFLHPKRPAVQRNLRRIRLIAGAAAATVVLLVLWGVRSHLIRQREKVKSDLQVELTEAQKRQPIYRQMRQQAATIEEWVKGGRNWLEHYAYLSAILPPSEEVYLTSFSISGRGAIHFAVQARSGEVLAKLDKQLRAAGYDVKPLAITPGSDKYGYGFRSSVELVVPDQMKIDLSNVRAPARPADDGSLNPTRKRGGAS